MKISAREALLPRLFSVCSGDPLYEGDVDDGAEFGSFEELGTQRAFFWGGLVVEIDRDLEELGDLGSGEGGVTSGDGKSAKKYEDTKHSSLSSAQISLFRV